ncbi:unnamed protein product [Rotaria magnacalcarata]|uniref:Uncharacterized protein n=2 Tax=Rotaria magnacalcarata TaxID=392030 RepID=A0A815CZ95_9BILA|nr:unnamed protein product [Rotaria magnacalcarata]
MNQIVASQPYVIENSVHLTRPGFDSFLQSDANDDPRIVDKHQAKRVYRLQGIPNVNTSFHLDTSDIDYETHGQFESNLRKQIDQSSAQPSKAVYHAPTDLSNESLAKFSFGNSRLDPQYLVPSQLTTVRNHPAALSILRHEKGPDHEIVPRFTDRLVSDRVIRARLGPGGALNPEEDCRQAVEYLQSQYLSYSEPNLAYSPRQKQQQQQQQESIMNELKRDELARQYMYTSVQQASYDDVPWDSKLPPKLPVPLASLEAYGTGPSFKPRRRPIRYDTRNLKILDWDRTEPRHANYGRKPFNNVAPLTRAQQIPGYSGSIGGYNLQDIDNPEIAYEPYTVVRTEQPKFSMSPRKANIPFYTGQTHWTKLDPVSHYDQSGHGYTTTAAFHKSLPLDNSSYRHSDLNGSLSRIVTTVMPQNPFNQIDTSSTTVNASLDSRSHHAIRPLLGKRLLPLKDNTKTDEQIVNNQVTN